RAGPADRAPTLHAGPAGPVRGQAADDPEMAEQRRSPVTAATCPMRRKTVTLVVLAFAIACPAGRAADQPVATLPFPVELGAGDTARTRSPVTAPSPRTRPSA